MNSKVFPIMITLFLTSILFLGTGCSVIKSKAPKETPTQSHEEHHPDVKNSEQDIQQMDMVKNGMMNKMDMNQCMSMMNQCMSMHKNEKTCDDQVMEKCQKNMNKKDCMQMIYDAKKNNKSTSVKK